VRVLDESTLVFPNYDGNGMFLSFGNTRMNPHVGMLFIDFEAGKRIRVNGSALARAGHCRTPAYVGAQFVVRVSVREVFPNCPRYIHKYQLVERSKFVPRREVSTPVPAWKRYEWARTSCRRRSGEGMTRQPTLAPGFAAQTLHQPFAFTSLPGNRLQGRHSSPSLPCSWMQLWQKAPFLYCGTLLGVDLARVVHVAERDRELLLFIEIAAWRPQPATRPAAGNAASPASALLRTVRRS
jgi:hypothetical protein